MADSKLTVIAQCKAKSGMEARVRQELVALVGPTREEPGCINYDLHVSREDPGRFLLYENWVSEKALEEHLAKPYLERFKGLAEKILDGPIEIRIYDMVSAPAP